MSRKWGYLCWGFLELEREEEGAFTEEAGIEDQTTFDREDHSGSVIFTL